MTETLVLLCAASIGSFGNNLISYFGNRSNLEIKRSICFCGKKSLSAVELIPIFNYVLQKGRCNTCGIKLPARYLTIEVLTILLGIACYYKYGISPELLINFFALFFLLIIGTVDLLKFKIPDKLLLSLLFVALPHLLLFSQIIFLNAIISAAIIIVLLAVKEFYTKYKRKDAIGYGDIKLIGILVLLYGFPLSLIGIWISSILGIAGYFVKKENENRIPLGFYLAISFLIMNFFNERIINLIYRLYGVN